MRRAAIMVGLVFVAGACSHPQTFTVGTTSPPTTVPVSAGCLAAMTTASAHGHGIDVSDAQIAADGDQTITECKSSAEWLTAVQGFIGPGDYNMITTDGPDGPDPDPSNTLSTICETTNLKNAPACAGVS